MAHLGNRPGRIVTECEQVRRFAAQDKVGIPGFHPTHRIEVAGKRRQVETFGLADRATLVRIERQRHARLGDRGDEQRIWSAQVGARMFQRGLDGFANHVRGKELRHHQVRTA